MQPRGTMARRSFDASSSSGNSRTKSMRGSCGLRVGSRSALHVVAGLFLATCGTSSAFRFPAPGPSSILRSTNSGSRGGRSAVSRRSAVSGVQPSRWAGGGRVIASSKPVFQQRRCGLFWRACCNLGTGLQIGERRQLSGLRADCITCYQSSGTHRCSAVDALCISHAARRYRVFILCGLLSILLFNVPNQGGCFVNYITSRLPPSSPPF